jgi:hypothetical protein
MPTYGTGNNKEYLVHVIAVLQLVEQKGTSAKVKEAFAALVAVRREMSPYFNFPEDETPAAKETRKKKLSDLNESLKAKKSFVVEQAQKAYELFRCFDVGKARTQWDRIVNKMHTKNPWIGVNGKSNKETCVKSWLSFRSASSLTNSPSSLLMQLKSSVITCSRQSRSPSESRWVNSCRTWAS